MAAKRVFPRAHERGPKSRRTGAAIDNDVTAIARVDLDARGVSAVSQRRRARRRYRASGTPEAHMHSPIRPKRRISRYDRPAAKVAPRALAALIASGPRNATPN